MQAEHDQRQAADGEADQQDFSRADMVGEIADRRLRQAGDDAEHGQRKTELDIADAELLLQERKQHRQHEQMEMADPMGDRNRRQRAQRSCPLWLVAVRPECRPCQLKTPLDVTARQGRWSKIVARRLFVHEYRCMAAPAEGRDARNASLNRKTKARRRGNDRTCLIPQNRSGCSFPRVPAPRPARPSRFWACRAITSRSAIPRPGAWRGSRASSENFTAARDCGTIRPVSGLYRAAAGRRAISMCCCRRMSRDFCLRGRGSASKAAPVSRCRVLRAIAPRTARPASAGCSISLGLPQPPTRIVTSAQRIARSHPVSGRRQDVGRHREPRHLVRAQCRRSRKRAARSRRRRCIRR